MFISIPIIFVEVHTVMFNKRLKQELLALREELSSVEQVRSSLDSEMLGMRLDPQGRIESVNGNFENEMLYRNSDLAGRLIDDLVPANRLKLRVGGGMAAHLRTLFHQGFDFAPGEERIVVVALAFFRPSGDREEGPRNVVVFQDRCGLGQDGFQPVVERDGEILFPAARPHDFGCGHKPEACVQRLFDLIAKHRRGHIIDAPVFLPDRVVAENAPDIAPPGLTDSRQDMAFTAGARGCQIVAAKTDPVQSADQAPAEYLCGIRHFRAFRGLASRHPPAPSRI